MNARFLRVYLLVAVIVLLTAFTAIAQESTPSPEPTLTAGDYYDLGLDYLDEENYTEAVEAFTRVIELDPDDVNAYYNRGVVYYLLDDKVQAWADLQDYARLAGDDANPEILEFIERLEAELMD